MIVVSRQHDLAPRGDPPAEPHLDLFVQQRELDPSDLLRMPGEDSLQAVAREVAAHRRVEHLAQPVQEQRPLELVDDRAIHIDVLPLGSTGQRKTLHGQQNGYAAQPVDELCLFHHRVDQFGRARNRIDLIAAGARDEAVPQFEGGAEFDQPSSARPSDLEALRRVHCLRSTEAERVDEATQAGCRPPVDPVFDLMRRSGMVDRVAGFGVASTDNDMKRGVAEPGQRLGAGRHWSFRCHDAAAACRLISLIRANSGLCR